MSSQESLRLSDGFELSHPSLSHSCRLMGLLDSVILILLSTVDRLRDQIPMSDAIASKLICDDFPGFTAM